MRPDPLHTLVQPRLQIVYNTLVQPHSHIVLKTIHITHVYMYLYIQTHACSLSVTVPAKPASFSGVIWIHTRACCASVAAPDKESVVSPLELAGRQADYIPLLQDDGLIQQAVIDGQLDVYCAVRPLEVSARELHAIAWRGTAQDEHARAGVWCGTQDALQPDALGVARRGHSGRQRAGRARERVPTVRRL